MNTELKNILAFSFAALKIGEDAYNKKNIFSMLPDVWDTIKEIPGVVGNAADLVPEIEALTNSANQADLATFIQTEVKGAGVSTNAEAILAASLTLVQHAITDITALVQAIKTPNASKLIK